MVPKSQRKTYPRNRLSRLKRSLKEDFNGIQSCVKDKVHVLVPKLLSSDKRGNAALLDASLFSHNSSRWTAILYYSWKTHGFFSILFLLLGLTGLGLLGFILPREGPIDGVPNREGANLHLGRVLKICFK